MRRGHTSPRFVLEGSASSSRCSASGSAVGANASVSFQHGSGPRALRVHRVRHSLHATHALINNHNRAAAVCLLTDSSPTDT